MKIEKVTTYCGKQVDGTNTAIELWSGSGEKLLVCLELVEPEQLSKLLIIEKVPTNGMSPYPFELDMDKAMGIAENALLFVEMDGEGDWVTPNGLVAKFRSVI